MSYEVVYHSNNSGGRWPLSDEDWRKLEAAGWDVAWFSNRDDDRVKHYRLDRDGTWLGAAAVQASYHVDTDHAPSAARVAIPNWEVTLRRDAEEAGCPTCGDPHDFSAHEVPPEPEPEPPQPGVRKKKRKL